MQVTVFQAGRDPLTFNQATVFITLDFYCVEHTFEKKVAINRFPIATIIQVCEVAE